MAGKDEAADPPTEAGQVNRRSEKRRRPIDAPAVRGVRLKYGTNVLLLDVSANGIRFRSDQNLAPNTTVVLELEGANGPALVPAQVVRSRRVVSGSFVWYEIACRVRRPNALRDLLG